MSDPVLDYLLRLATDPRAVLGCELSETLVVGKPLDPLADAVPGATDLNEFNEGDTK